MSELQAALLAIGLGVVVAVYVFGWWKQRQYSRKFGAAFRQSHDDALYQAKTAQPAPTIVQASEPVIVNWDAMASDAVVELPQVEDVLPVLPVVEDEPLPVPVTQAEDSEAAPVELCSLLDARCDFIVEVDPDQPCSVEYLDELWQRRGEFGKPVQVCGLTLNSVQWEKVLPDSHACYSKFQIALQLVDRGGVIALPTLGVFCDLVQRIADEMHADMSFPDINATHRNAQTMDAFCADVDQLVGVNLLPQSERPLNAGKIAQAAALLDMKLESDGSFHLHDASGRSVMTLVNQDARPFQSHTLAHFSTPGVTLLLDVPRVEHPAEVFDHLVHIAQSFARSLPANLVDDHRVQLTDAALARTRTQIVEVDAKMCARNLAPGSVHARRLFS
jgi:FtsZ-interacting cell division protein ZipA